MKQDEVARRAFTTFYESHAEPAVRFAFLLVGDAGLAEEITQQVFTEVWGRFDTLRDPAAYLHTCLVNAARGRMRREIVARRVAPLLIEAAGAEDTYDGFDQLVADLTDRQRTAVYLRYYLDLPEREIAKVMGCRPGTVKSTLHAALRRLEVVLR